MVAGAVMSRERTGGQSKKNQLGPARLHRKTLDKLVILAQRRGVSVAEMLDELAFDVIEAEYRAELAESIGRLPSLGRPLGLPAGHSGATSSPAPKQPKPTETKKPR